MSMFYELLMRAKEVYAIIKGNPTENPSGVFSNFTDDNYLITNEKLPEDVTEVQVEFTMMSTIPSSGTQAIFNAGLTSLTLYNKQVSMYDSGYKNIIPQSDTTGGSTYVVRCLINGKSLSFSYSKDGGAFIDSLNFTTRNNYNVVKFGIASAGRSFKGSINLNNTFIKRIGNRYWFKGKTKQGE